ncbi:MAG TPA: MFS transporter [Gaiellaceae bacterium]|jgi:EmrB/QacA subfamily drug resistance transporter
MTAQTIVSPSETAHVDRKWLTLALVVAAQFMVVLDVAIVNVALPSIKTDLNFSQESLQWVITAYGILFGGALLLGGRLSDLFGRRRLFMAGLVLFTVSSAVDSLAWSSGSLIAARAVQGLGAALLSPAALSILTTTFREGRERNIALGIWGAASGSGGAVGVLLGGLLTSTLGWPWIFYVNLPVGALLFAAAPALLRAGRADIGHRHLDARGAATITGGLMLMVYAMTRASQHGWGSATTIELLTASAALLVSFVALELRSPAPLLPMRLFRLRTLAVSNVTQLLVATAMYSQFFLLTLYMQEVLHYSPLQTGVAYLAFALTVVVVANFAQALVTRFGIRRVLPVGLTIAAIGVFDYTQLPVHGHYFWNLFPAMPIAGLGMALSFVPMVIGGLTGIETKDAGVASGLFTTSQQIGGAIGVAAVTTIATSFTKSYVNVHPGATALGANALTHGFQIGFYVLASMLVLAAIVSATLIERRPEGDAVPADVVLELAA